MTGACTGALAAVAVLLLAGCAPEPVPTPTASVSSPAPTASAPSASATPSASPTPSATPTPNGPPATRPVEPPTGTDPDAAGMNAAQAGQLCAAEQRNGLGAGDTQVGDPTAYERTIDPQWYVTILAENEFGQYYQECVLGGSADDPEWSVVQQTPKDQLTKAHIEQMRTENEGFDEDH
ncbi:hypothetical protein Q9S71_12865 [Microbacterium sp. KSW4-11]|uniref:Uncharacterized protein n=1 Tax=Microbacterium gawkjiense TaxID=3067309 RepID=A0ABU3GD23_9MICO|nr:hypothetical protein [Microbacterium sp. KSW4-11]MDT3317711.1 hypothetical protein [Microbacterium sp. KSW4-11]